ncbi:hypothetical protein JavanS193_0018 [Streptococcus satellite phage Javan193]|nr:hypothetical protein JavanS193_0018 [Streptococcus satellite phage Javan193]QBX07841.1 hypothetical protein JavanS194_0018 [Streptococcus satellite phage Javan194]QBX07860.1 hypothetical protein JavanS195_0016 [Streptococcus satellite phage Javan195]
MRLLNSNPQPRAENLEKPIFQILRTSKNLYFEFTKHEKTYYSDF